ncbi:serine/threonine-protein kinase [Actinoplanes sp. NBRC 101535]|uniref:serine/threonine-protein kinase n=1 Tax=Actinoplanes sp. NBRC 101535 TaxID=3032196 RepID=UPI0024A3ADD3|nr:serine/threonine-protein kinase [Actinoplanes sp. NBRC 101535]GLY07949.1 hypothetical protein Acsp01_83280 [Actinoplanes sp. NBRC 101535]
MPTPLRPDDPRFLGRYQLVARLGEGGMGAVFLGRDGDGRQAAIKVIKAEYARQEQFRARFRSEVAKAREVPSFCTAEVLDADPEHDTPYLVVEYVDGPSLADVVRGNGPLRGGSLHSVAVGVASALVAIHRTGIVHRDLKPANVMFAYGSPKVIDFGIAKGVDAATDLTGTQEVVGTLAYMSPERFDPDTGQRPTPAADIFAWGALIAYAATGRSPFDADTPVAIAGRILTQPPSLEGLPPRLAGIVERALDKDPGRRPTAPELLNLLLTTGTDTEAPLPVDVRLASEAAQRTTVLPTSALRKGRRRGLVAGSVAVVLVLGLAGAWAGTTLAQQSSSAASSPVASPVSSPVASPAVVGDAGDDSGEGRPVTADEIADIVDPLTARKSWKESGTGTAGCRFDDGLLVRARNEVACTGPARSFTDVMIEVTVDIGDNVCATAYFRRDAAGDGYALYVCPEIIHLGRQIDGEYIQDSWVDTGTVGASQIQFGTPGEHRLQIIMIGAGATISLDDKNALNVDLEKEGLDAPDAGRVTFGAMGFDPDGTPTVTFRDARITSF